MMNITTDSSNMGQFRQIDILLQYQRKGADISLHSVLQMGYISSRCTPSEPGLYFIPCRGGGLHTLADALGTNHSGGSPAPDASA